MVTHVTWNGPCPYCENFVLLSRACGLGDNVDELLSTLTIEPAMLFNCLTKASYTFKQWDGGLITFITKSKSQVQDLLQSQGKVLAEHLAIKRAQSSALTQMKNNLQPGSILIHSDFAENYSIRHQDETMEANWASTPGVVLYTAGVYFREAAGSEYTPLHMLLLAMLTRLALFKWHVSTMQF